MMPAREHAADERTAPEAGPPQWPAGGESVRDTMTLRADLIGLLLFLGMDVVCRTISADLLNPQHPLAVLPISNDPSLWS
jgi:hypothetical protein